MPRSELPARLICQSEAAAWLGVSTRTIRRWARAGLIREIRIGRTARYVISDLLGSDAMPEVTDSTLKSEG